MKKQYPYLEDSYFYDTDVERQKRTVLEDIQKFVNQRQYIKMTLLDGEERPLKEIEGEISSGSISKNGDSPVRRTANLSCAVDARSYSVEDGKADFAINKKIFIEIGILNETDKYPDYPIFWFPQGVFFIGSFTINSSSTGSTNISLTLKDKMAMLNGDVGGTLPALVIFDSMDTQLPDGSYATKKVLIYNIIKECVNHYGGEDLNNIVIEDVPLRIRRIMRGMGDIPLYMINTTDIAQTSQADFHFQLEEPSGGPYDEETNPYGYKIYYTGDDIGYVRDDFVVIDELVGNAGETVVSVLDKIKNLLGNYEYFYDVFGIFHFREIKNYLNTTQGEKLLSEMAEKDYLVEINNERSTFTFSDESILTSITVTPKYENIKNDFIIQGLREGTSSDIAYDIRYHLAIDTKPRPIGVDNREQIIFPKDFSKQIAAGEADLLTLQNKIAEGQQQKNNHQSVMNKLEMRKEQRYREVIKYGDLLKRELQLILGDFSFPQDQPIGNLGLNEGPTNYSDWDKNTNLPDTRPYFYYSEEFWNKYKEDVIQYLDNSNISGNKDFVNAFINNSLKYNQHVYENLTPEGFWFLIQEKILQNLYVDIFEQEYNRQEEEWNNALNNVMNHINGYKQITPTKIQTPEKIYVYKPTPVTFGKDENGKSYIEITVGATLYRYPRDFYNPTLIELCANQSDANKIKNIKNIYTDYILFLQNKVIQQSDIVQTVEDEIAIDNLEEQEIQKILDKYRYIAEILAIYPAVLDDIYTFKVSDLSQSTDIYNSIRDILYQYYVDNWSEETSIAVLKSKDEGESQIDEDGAANFRNNFIYLKIKDYFSSIGVNYPYVLSILAIYPEMVDNISDDFKISNLDEHIYDYICLVLRQHYIDNLPPEMTNTSMGEEEGEPERADKYGNENFKDIFLLLKSKEAEESKYKDSFYYADLADEIEELSKTLEDLRAAVENSQNNNISLSGLYNDDSLIKKGEGINIYYNRYQTELANYYLVLKDIEEREKAPAITKLSAQEIHTFLTSTNGLTKEYNTYLTQPPQDVVIVLEKAIDKNFSPSDNTLKYDYLDTGTAVADKLKEIIDNWVAGVMELIPNPHQGQKYYGFYNTRDIIIYKDPETDTIKAGFSFYAEEDASDYVDRIDLPVPGNFNLIYKRPNENKYCYGDGQTYQDLVVKHVFKCNKIESRYYIYDGRTLLYLEGQYARILGTDAGYYYPELSAFWPRTYDVFNQCFYEEPWTSGRTNDRDLTKGNYFLDFLDSIDTTFGEGSVNNIGRRSDVVVNNEINCLFQPEIPNVNLININSNSPGSPSTEQEVYDASDEIPDSLRYLEQSDKDLKGKPKVMYLRAESIYANEPYTQVDSEIYNNLLTGGYANGAFDQIKYELFLHTRYQKTISMTTIPVFYLEPNSRVTIADKTTNTFGDFVIQNISLTLGPGANMSVSTVETVERF